MAILLLEQVRESGQGARSVLRGFRRETSVGDLVDDGLHGEKLDLPVVGVEPGRETLTFTGFSQVGEPTPYGRFGQRPVDDIENASIVPGSRLSFEDSETGRLPTDGAAIDHIGFEIQDWDAFIEILEGAGIQFEFGPTYVESLDLWVAFFNDPSGVLVEITHGLDPFWR